MSKKIRKIAVLISGGLDSLILLKKALDEEAWVYPIYIQKGLYWENTELKSIHKTLEHFSSSLHLKKLKILKSPFDDIEPQHWAYTGEDVPDASTPDEAVEIPMRNLQFLIKSSQYCIKEKIHEIYLGTLKNNPFPDAQKEFFQSFEDLIYLSSNFSLKVKTPFSNLSKKEIITQEQDLPLDLSFSCLQPEEDLHCGNCNKCYERKLAFAEAQVEDKTRYQAA